MAIDPGEQSQQIRKLSAIMFSDIVGYSKKMGMDESGTLRLLVEHDAIVRPLVERHKGSIIKTAGDGVMASFDSAVNAVRCAVKMQQAFRGYNKTRPKAQEMWLRIGIHLGDVIVKGNDLFGDGVNIASRLEHEAQPGGICISHDVYHQVKNKVEIETVHFGPVELKNIEERVDVYHLVLDAMDRDRLTRRMTGAPAHATPGKGRLIGLIVAALLLIGLGVIGAKAWQKRHAPARERESAGSSESERGTEDAAASSAGTEPPASRYASMIAFPFAIRIEGRVAPALEKPMREILLKTAGELNEALLAAMAERPALRTKKLNLAAVQESRDPAEREQKYEKLTTDRDFQRRLATEADADTYLRGTLAMESTGKLRKKITVEWNLVATRSEAVISTGSLTLNDEASVPGKNPLGVAADKILGKIAKELPEKE